MKNKVFTYLHSHWDREWYKSFERFRHRLIEVLDDILGINQAQNYIDFYKNEIERRELHNFPPFCQIIKIVISSLNELRAQKCAEEVSNMLINQIDKLGLTEYIEVTGAMPCLMHKINSEYRFQILRFRGLGSGIGRTILYTGFPPSVPVP